MKKPTAFFFSLIAMMLASITFGSYSVAHAAVSPVSSIQKPGRNVPTAPTLSLTTAPPVNCLIGPCPESVGLQWSESSYAATYQLYRNNVLIRTVSASSGDFSYIDEVEGSYVTYSYVVKASNPFGSAYSNTLYYTTKDITTPSAPANLTAQRISVGQLYGPHLSWEASTDNVGVDYYIITRQRSDSPEKTTRFIVAAKNTTYDDLSFNAISHAFTYYYSVVAVDVAGNVSLASNTVVFNTGETD